MAGGAKGTLAGGSCVSGSKLIDHGHRVATKDTITDPKEAFVAVEFPDAAGDPMFVEIDEDDVCKMIGIAATYLEFKEWEAKTPAEKLLQAEMVLDPTVQAIAESIGEDATSSMVLLTSLFRANNVATVNTSVVCELVTKPADSPIFSLWTLFFGMQRQTMTTSVDAVFKWIIANTRSDAPAAADPNADVDKSHDPVVIADGTAVTKVHLWDNFTETHVAELVGNDDPDCPCFKCSERNTKGATGDIGPKQTRPGDGGDKGDNGDNAGDGCCKPGEGCVPPNPDIKDKLCSVMKSELTKCLELITPEMLDALMEPYNRAIDKMNSQLTGDKSKLCPV
jgi:hypothetical protein